MQPRLLRRIFHSVIVQSEFFGATRTMGVSFVMTSITPAIELSDISAAIALESRKPWSTPRVIVSVAQNAEAHVGDNPPDGSTTFSVYGS